jgi:outer membrane protein assembly factor BamB
MYANTEKPQPALANPVLWTLSGRQVVGELGVANALTKYDATRGTQLLILTPPVNQSFAKVYFDTSNFYAYAQMGVTYPNGTTGTRLVKLDTTGTQRTYAQRVIWDVPAPAGWYNFMGVWGDYIIDASSWGVVPSGLMAISTETGELVWNNHPLEGLTLMCPGVIAYGKVFYPDSEKRVTAAFDISTGKKVWESEPRELPWGAFTAYNEAAAYGKVYIQCYDGHIYAYNAETGKTEWKVYSGDTVETPYGTWPWWSGIAIADGKIYAGTSEHSPTPPFMRGCRMYCLNATTGDELWSIAFANGGDKSIADGTLIATNEYDSIMYAFDKGPTDTTVTASPKVTVHGSSVLVEGTITDQSPAQLGTPAIADEYMSAWMEYLHMQKPRPTNATGVEVIIEVLDPNNNYYEVGRATSDASGFYKLTFTPPVPGEYTVIARFAGSKSYWASSTETAINVENAPQPTPAPTPTPIPMSEMYFLPLSIGMIVAIIVVGALLALLLLRKR